MVIGGARPFQELLRNRNFNLVGDAVDRAIVRRAQTDALEDFVVDDRDVVVAVAKRRARGAAKRAARRASSSSKPSEPANASP